MTRNSCNESRVTLKTLANASSVTTSRPSCCSLTSTPSSVMFDWSARPPFTKPERVTPGCSDNKPTTLLALSGNSTMRFRSKELPIVASLVLIAASAAEVTSTVSETAPISSGTSRTVGVSTKASTPETEAVLKPVAVISSLYVPGGTALKTYWPSSLVCCVRVKFLVGSVRVTVAPLTRLPCGSLTVPRTVVPPDCANAVTANSISTRNEAREILPNLTLLISNLPGFHHGSR